jgi:ATP synthase protein I
MPEIQELFSQQRRWMFFLLSIYVLGWGFTSYQSIFLGLMFGTSLSLFNLRLMVRKMNKFEESFLQGKKVGSLGSFSRFATAGFATLVALRYPEQIHLISMVIGLMTSYIVMVVSFLINNGKRGE